MTRSPSPRSPSPRPHFPRRRLDALSDAIFGVAMTLLVLEVRLPEDVDITTDQALMTVLVSLLAKIGWYVLSFAILGIRWRELAGDRVRGAAAGRAYVNWMLLNLLLVTFVPFTTLLIGRYAMLAPAVWLYAANLAGMATCSWLGARSVPASRAVRAEETAGFLVFMGSAVATVALGFTHTAWAPMGFALNALAPPVERWVRRRHEGAKGAESGGGRRAGV